MQFKHPEILYFLALLLIPILVHLFQLQKFVKVPFTNVAFLQKIVTQTRKSSQLKKWLILFTRMLLLASIIIAFAQPYFSNKKINERINAIIYLDNSLSTNTKSERGNSLEIAKQDIINTVSDNNHFCLITNTDFHENLSASELKSKLKEVKHTSIKANLNTVLLKIKSSKIATNSNKVLISDFQNTDKKVFNDSLKNVSLVQLLPEERNNLSIDSVYIHNNKAINFNITTVIKNQGVKKKNVPIAIYNGSKLISKQTFSIDENATKEVSFVIQKTPKFLGTIKLTYGDAFSFDNFLNFTINTSKKINVLAIGDDNEFLSKIYTKDEFNFSNFSLKTTNYNLIDKQQLIILNELSSIPNSLSISITNFIKNGGNIVIIPHIESDIQSYNLFFKNIGIGKINTIEKDSLKVTKINFKHPLFNNVFEKNVKNFQYPTVSSHFTDSFSNANSLVYFENNTGFIKEIKRNNTAIFWIAAALNKANSNFTNSPLIVPVFYNIGEQSLHLSKLYYTINENSIIDVNTKIGKDNVLMLSNEKESFIPLQQTLQNKVSITTNNKPSNAGFYSIIQEKDTLSTIAFNYPKGESSLSFLNLKDLNNKDIVVASSAKNVLQNINNYNKVHWLWKWFLALAIVSLLLEILILKFFKP